MAIEIKLESNLAEVVAKMGDIAQKRMEEAVNKVRNTTLQTLSGPRTGRIYTIPGTHKKYTASSPGEPPAQRLGELRQSVSTLVVGRGAELTGAVGTDKDYGMMLEYGTKSIAPRPWLRPSFEKAEAAIKAIFEREWF